MQALKTTNPLAPNVAAEYGASCNQDANGVYHIGNGVTSFRLTAAGDVVMSVRP